MLRYWFLHENLYNLMKSNGVIYAKIEPHLSVTVFL